MNLKVMIFTHLRNIAHINKCSSQDGFENSTYNQFIICKNNYFSEQKIVQSRTLYRFNTEANTGSSLINLLGVTLESFLNSLIACD